MSFRMPPRTWKAFAPDTVVELPFFPRDDWGRDVTDAYLLGSEDADAQCSTFSVPIELPERVKLGDEVFRLMLTRPDVTYWREQSEASC